MGKAGGRLGVAPPDDAAGAALGKSFAFVGRRRELGLLLAALERPPAVVLVEGEAGIGKSRLVHEAMRTLADAEGRVLTGFCHPLREPFPFGPVADALGAAGSLLPPVEQIPRSAGVLAPLLPDLAARLPEPPPRSEDPHAERYQLMRGLRSLLAAVGPAVLVIEDVHWVDEATRELLVLLTRDMPAQLSLILTCRTEDLPPGAALLGSAYRRQPGTSGVAIRLDPLPEAAVQELARDALGAAATPEIGQVLYERSEGLPLVAEEDLITLREGGWPGILREASDLAADLEQAELPRGLREAFNERLAGMSRAASSLVEAAAVLGVPASEQVLAQVAGLDQDRGSAGLTEALRRAVLTESGPGLYSFRHALAQQVAYQQLSGPRRRRLHLRAIEVLQTQSPPPLVQIAYHTGQLGDEKAWLLRAEAAVDQAIELGDNGTAAMLLHRILDQPHLDTDLRSRAALALARIIDYATDYVLSAAALRRLLADPQLTKSTRGEIRLALGLLMVNQAGDRAGILEIERAAEELVDHPARASRAMIVLAMYERDGAVDHAREWMDRAEAVIKSGPHAVARAAARATRLSMQARMGDPGVWARLDQLPRQADDIEIVRQTARALYNAGEFAGELGHDGRAARLLTESRELAERASDHVLVHFSRIALLRLEVLAGKWTKVEDRFAALRREYPDIAMSTTYEALTVSIVAAARGQRGLAWELLSAAATTGEAEPQVTFAVEAAAGLAGLRLADDAPGDAWQIAAPALALLRQARAWARGGGLVPIAVEAALARGDRPAAERLMADAEQGLRGRDAPAAVAELYLARGLLLGASGPAAAECFDRARRLWSDIGRPYDTARAAERLGIALAPDDPARAGSFLTEAITTYSELGASRDLARAHHSVQELGLAQPAVRGRRGYGDRLSPREQQVAELLARGCTNQEIADALFLSPRTVEQHVARALKKLGCTRGRVGEVLKRGTN